MKVLNWYGGSYVYYEEEPVETPAPTSKAEPEPQGWTLPQRRARGLVLGRFLPVHRGHQYLLQFAQQRVEALTVIVRQEATDSIPAEVRVEWISELAPRAHVTALAGLAEHRMESDWIKSVGEQLEAVDLLFSSERCHEKFASLLRAQFVCVDPDRQVVPISGTVIRAHPLAHWDFLPTCVRPYYVRTVRVVGPEGSGKTTLTTRLAQAFGTVHVPEFAAALAAHRGRTLKPRDFVEWGEAHRAAREVLQRQAKRLLFLDTDLLTVGMWARRLLGRAPQWTETQKACDLTFLLAPLPGGDFAARKALHADWLGRRDDSFVLLEGDPDHQFRVALTAIADRLGVTPTSGG